MATDSGPQMQSKCKLAELCGGLVWFNAENMESKFSLRIVFITLTVSMGCLFLYDQARAQAPAVKQPASTKQAAPAPGPFDKLDLLALAIGTWSQEYAAEQVRLRGISFTPDEVLLDAVRRLGGQGPLLHALSRQKPSRPLKLSADRAKAYAFLLLVAKLISAGQFSIAADEYRQALEVIDDSAMLHLAYATDLLLLKDYSKAEAESRRSLSLWPDNADAHCLLGTALGSQGRDHEAVHEARAALELFPQHKVALIQLGFSLTRDRQYAEAVPVLRGAIPRSPEMPLLRKHLGLSLLRTRDVSGAISELRTFLQQSP